MYPSMRRSESKMANALENKTLRAPVYCPLCTHTVEAEVVAVQAGWNPKRKVASGQRCRRCSSSLDAAYVLDLTGNLYQ